MQRDEDYVGYRSVMNMEVDGRRKTKYEIE
jgi:hypothetical protein